MQIRKIIAVIIFPILIVGAFYPGIVGNTALYFINGKSITVNGYKINFPFSHWALYKEDQYSYILSGRKIGKHALKIEVFKNPHRLNVNLIKQNCKERLLKTLNISKEKDIFVVTKIINVCFILYQITKK